MKKTHVRLLSVAALSFALVACAPPDDGRRLVGQLESDRVEITAEFSEPIIERLVAEGELVEIGQLLIRQDTSRVETRIAEADATVRQNRARLAELIRGPRKELIVAEQAKVDGAVKDLAFRETEMKRIEDLYTRGLVSPRGRDQSQANRDVAQANLENLEARLDELLSGTTVEELRQAEESVKVAEARLDGLSVDRDRHSAMAPVAGVIDTLLFEPGERPGVGQPMVILLSGEQVYARIFVPESLRVQVSPGVAANVFVDGLNAPVEGIVRWVSSEAAFTPYFALTEDDRGRLSFSAKIDIIGLDRRLPDGVPVEVELLLNRDEN